jgi:hypothetical protein
MKTYISVTSLHQGNDRRRRRMPGGEPSSASSGCAFERLDCFEAGATGAEETRKKKFFFFLMKQQISS